MQGNGFSTFTFQYGYFIVYYYSKKSWSKSTIYIPVWLFYSLSAGLLSFSSTSAFTFQYGYFIVNLKAGGRMKHKLIYIPVWLFYSLLHHTTLLHKPSHLHSSMVIL